MDLLNNTFLSGAVLGGLITSIIGPYIVKTKERRELRADVLNAIYEVETRRWVPESKYDEFQNSIRKLRATALIARTDRRLLDHYIYLARVCRHKSDSEYDNAYDKTPEFAGGIPSALSKLAEDAAEALVTALWHPVRTSAFRKSRLNKLIDQQRFLEHEHNDWPWEAVR